VCSLLFGAVLCASRTHAATAAWGAGKGGFLARVQATLEERSVEGSGGGGGEEAAVDPQLAPRLAKMLRRPLTHMWQPTHEQRRSVGNNRWSPGT
jgi:hypothetical protein